MLRSSLYWCAIKSDLRKKYLTFLIIIIVKEVINFFYFLVCYSYDNFFYLCHFFFRFSVATHNLFFWIISFILFVLSFIIAECIDSILFFLWTRRQSFTFMSEIFLIQNLLSFDSSTASNNSKLLNVFRIKSGFFWWNFFMFDRFNESTWFFFHLSCMIFSFTSRNSLCTKDQLVC